MQELIVYIILAAVAAILVRYVYRQATSKGTACHCGSCPRTGSDECHCHDLQP